MQVGDDHISRLTCEFVHLDRDPVDVAYLADQRPASVGHPSTGEQLGQERMLPQQPVPVGHASARAGREAAAVFVNHPVGARQDHRATTLRPHLAEESEQLYPVHGP